MLVTLFGMVIPVSPVQPENAEYTMLFMLPGSVTFFRLLQSANAAALIFVTPSVMNTVFSLSIGIFISASVSRSMVFPTVNVVSAVQPENAPSPMLVTLSGIVTSVIPMQP